MSPRKTVANLAYKSFLRLLPKRLNQWAGAVRGHHIYFMRTKWHARKSFVAKLVGAVGLFSSLRVRLSKCDQKQSSDSLDSSVVQASLDHYSPRCKRFVAWVLASGIDVVVFDMDLTMGSGHCGEGLKLEELQSYVSGASPDFIEAVGALSGIPGIRLAVATNSDPAEYDLPGQSRQTHILGPDLAAALLRHWCPEALHKFEIMVGFDHNLHRDVPVLLGKSWHMRRIAEHYKVDFSRMVLIDDTASRLENSDGWRGVLVRDQQTGFRFEDCFEDDCLPPHARAARRKWPQAL